MKRTLCILFCLLLTASLTVPALADVIWEPDDDFYFAHANECRLSDEGYTAAEDTTLYASPIDPTPAGVLPAGESAATRYIWTDTHRDEWGYAEFYTEDGWVQGWLNLTHPDVRPASPFQSMTVVLIVGVLALTAAGIMFFGRKKI